MTNNNIDFVQLNLQRFEQQRQEQTQLVQQQLLKQVDRKRLIENNVSNKEWFKRQKVDILRQIAKETMQLSDVQVEGIDEYSHKKLLSLVQNNCNKAQKLNIRQEYTSTDKDVLWKEMDFKEEMHKWSEIVRVFTLGWLVQNTPSIVFNDVSLKKGQLLRVREVSSNEIACSIGNSFSIICVKFQWNMQYRTWLSPDKRGYFDLSQSFWNYVTRNVSKGSILRIYRFWKKLSWFNSTIGQCTQVEINCDRGCSAFRANYDRHCYFEVQVENYCSSERNNQSSNPAVTVVSDKKTIAYTMSTVSLDKASRVKYDFKLGLECNTLVHGRTGLPEFVHLGTSKRKQGAQYQEVFLVDFRCLIQQDQEMQQVTDFLNGISNEPAHPAALLRDVQGVREIVLDYIKVLR